MKPSKLLHQMKTKHLELEDKPLEFFERRKRDREGEKRLLRTALSTNSNALRASYLVFHRIVKTNKPFTIGEKLIPPVCTKICREVLGESAAKKRAQVSLSARIVRDELRIWRKTLKLNCYSGLSRHHSAVVPNLF